MTLSKFSGDRAVGIREALALTVPERWQMDHTQLRSRRGRYFFYATLANHLTVQSLFDPGAEATLLRSSIYHRWPLKRHYPGVPTQGLTGAFGHGSSETLRIKVPVSAMGQRHEVNMFVVKNLNVDMIAGADMIDVFKISLDAVSRRLVSPDSIRVSVVSGQQIGPYECGSVTLRLERRVNNISQVAIDSAENSRLWVTPVLARLSKDEDRVSVPVWNLGPQEIDTREVCAVVAQATPVDKVLSAKELMIGELDMPPLTPVSKEKRDYLMAKIKIGSSANANQADQLRSLVLKYHQAFGAHPFDLGRTQTHMHTIRLKDPNQPPVFQRQFRIPQAHQKIIEDNVKQMLEMKVIRPSKSAWNSCVFLVAKQGGGWRFVTDLRPLNEASIDNLHTGITIDELTQQIGQLKADTFSCMDILKGFWQLPLHPDSQDLTQFSIPNMGSFCYTTTPMGLQGSVYAFWTLVNAVTYQLENSFAYIDDLLTASRGVDCHLEHLEKLFRRICQHKLTLNIEKCEFMRPSVQYLGFEVSGDGVRPGAPKIEVLRKCPPPRTVKEIKAYLGLGGFFYRHLPFQREAKHLSVLTRKESGWKGGELPPRALKAFENIKKMLTTRPLLRYPDYSRPFHLFSDAATGSANQVKEDITTASIPEGGQVPEVQPGGIGCFLGQEDEKGQMYVIGWGGRGLKKHEAAYSAFHLEHLAGVYALEEFQHIIRGHPTTLHMDHKPITFLTSMKQKSLMRLQEKILEQQNLTIEYTPGPLNGTADCMSRFACKIEAVTRSSTAEKGERTQPITLHMLPYSNQEVKTLQRMDPFIFKLIQFVRGQGNTPEGRRWGPKCFFGDNGVLYYRVEAKGQGRPLITLLLPEPLRKEVIRNAHDSSFGGHAGVAKVQSLLAEMFWWPSLLNDAAEFVLSCDRCQKMKKSNQGGPNPIIPLPAEDSFGGRVHLDLLGRFEGVGRVKYVLICTDSFTKYAEFIPLETKNAQEVAEKFYQNWILRHSVPVQICTDQGKEFRNQLMARLLDHLGVQSIQTTPFHPSSNAAVEVINKTAGRYLRSCAEAGIDDLEPYLAPLQFHYNLSIHKSTKFSPFELVYARKARWPYWDPEGQQEMFMGELAPDDLIRRAQEARALAFKNNMDFRDAYTFNFNKDKEEKEFKKGDLVLLHAPLMTKRDLGVINAKLNSPWIGPLRVERTFPETHNLLLSFPPKGRRAKKQLRVHFDRVKRYILRPGAKDPFSSPDSAEQEDPIPQELRNAEPQLVDVDDPTLTLWGQEEKDLETWETVHERKEDVEAPKLVFDPVSPPVGIPGDQEVTPQLQPEEIRENQTHFQPMPLEEIDNLARPVTRQMVRKRPSLAGLLTKFSGVFRRTRRK